MASEEAQISGEMARTRLITAKAVLAEREKRFAHSLERLHARQQRAARELAARRGSEPRATVP